MIRQPTPQKGQTESTWRSTACEPISVLGISAPVGQACTHSPQATQRAFAHGVVQVEHHLGVRAAQCQADDVVDLRFAAGAHAAVALDAGVEVDGHGRMGQVGAGCSRRRAVRAGRGVTPRRAAQALSSPWRLRPAVVAVPLVALLRQVGQQQLQHHLLALAARAGSAHAPSGPARGVRQQLGASVRSPSISTTQARQLPSGRRPSLWHRCGISTPWRRAAARWFRRAGR